MHNLPPLPQLLMLSCNVRVHPPINPSIWVKWFCSHRKLQGLNCSWLRIFQVPLSPCMKLSKIIFLFLVLFMGGRGAWNFTVFVLSSIWLHSLYLSFLRVQYDRPFSFYSNLLFIPSHSAAWPWTQCNMASWFSCSTWSISLVGSSPVIDGKAEFLRSLMEPLWVPVSNTCGKIIVL